MKQAMPVKVQPAAKATRAVVIARRSFTVKNDHLFFDVFSMIYLSKTPVSGEVTGVK